MITQQQALEMFGSDDLVGLGMAADAVRKDLHPDGLVTYCLDTGAVSVAAELVFGAQEPLDAILGRLSALRQLQEERGDMLAVMPRSEGTAAEYLKILALTRIYLDNVPHIQVAWQAGMKVGQIALRFGANDINGAEAGGLRATEEEIRRLIRDGGFVPKQRDARFETYFLN